MIARRNDNLRSFVFVLHRDDARDEETALHRMRQQLAVALDRLSWKVTWSVYGSNLYMRKGRSSAACPCVRDAGIVHRAATGSRWWRGIWVIAIRIDAAWHTYAVSDDIGQCFFDVKPDKEYTQLSATAVVAGHATGTHAGAGAGAGAGVAAGAGAVARAQPEAGEETGHAPQSPLDDVLQSFDALSMSIFSGDTSRTASTKATADILLSRSRRGSDASSLSAWLWESGEWNFDDKLPPIAPVSEAGSLPDDDDDDDDKKAVRPEQRLRVVTISCIHDEDVSCKHNDVVLSSLEEAVDDNRDAWVMEVVIARTVAEAAALQDACQEWLNVLVIIGDMHADGSGFQLCGGETWTMESVARAVARPEARIGMVVVLAPKCDPHSIQAAVRALGYSRRAAVIGAEREVAPSVLRALAGPLMRQLLHGDATAEESLNGAMEEVGLDDPDAELTLRECMAYEPFRVGAGSVGREEGERSNSSETDKSDETRSLGLSAAESRESSSTTKLYQQQLRRRLRHVSSVRASVAWTAVSLLREGHGTTGHLATVHRWMASTPHDVVVQRTALAALVSAARSTTLRPSLGQYLPTVLSSLRRHATVAKVVETAFMLLRRMAQDTENVIYMASTVGLAGAVLDGMARHARRARVQHAGVHALQGLARSSTLRGRLGKQKRLGHVLGSVMSTHAGLTEASAGVLRLVHVLAQQSPSTAQQLGECETVLTGMVQVLQRLPRTESVQTVGLQAVEALASCNSNQARIVDTPGLLDLVARSVRRREASAQLQSQLVSCLASLSGNAEAMRRCATPAVARAVHRQLAAADTRHDASSHTARCLQVAASIATASEATAAQWCGSSAAWKRVYRAMKRCKGLATVEAAGERLITVLLEVAAKAEHQEEAEVAFATMQQVARRSRSHSSQLAKMTGVLELTAAALKQHVRVGSTVAAILGAAADVAFSTASREYLGGVAVFLPTVVAAMQQHATHATVQLYGFWTIKNVASNCMANKARLSEEPALVEVFCAALVAHKDNTRLVRQVFAAANNLSWHIANAARFSSSPAFLRLLVVGMETHCQDVDVQRYGLSAIASMATVDFGAADRLVNAEWLLAGVLTALQRHRKSSRVQQHACRAISNLTLHSAKARAAVGAVEGLLEAMVAGIQAHTDHEDYPHNQRKGLDAIANLCFHNADNAARVAATKGIFPTLAAAVALRPTQAHVHAAVQESARRAISNLVLQNESCAEALRSILPGFTVAQALCPPQACFPLADDFERDARADLLTRMAMRAPRAAAVTA